jgi:nucleoside-diphosphate-sugar epimerase
MNSVIVFGGAGYIGNVLVPKLLANGWHVTVYDTFWFGDFLAENENLKKIKGDIRDIDKVENAIKGNEFVLHLSCISNDASFELDERISTSINLESFEPVVIAAKNQNVKRFIFASSSSVYGISEKNVVKEVHPLVP